MLINIKKILFLIFFTLSYCVFAQKISVKSFELLSNDLEARINPVKFDGDACALIKIETVTKNLIFEGGSLGIAKVVQKKGEVWVYVPYGARFLTIKHEELGVLRNYEYPTGKLQKSTTYALQLTTAKIITTIEEKLPQFGSIKSNPEGADVYIDGVRVGTTPTKSLSLLEGTHTIKITKHLYESIETSLNVTADKKFSKKYTLIPKFGIINVESKPESGASITIDGKLQKETTPATISFLEQGSHTIKIGKDLFDISQQDFSIQNQETKSIVLTMQPLYGELSITTNPKSSIYVDNQEKGVGSWSGRLLKGIHLISVSKDKYNTINKNHTVVIGEKKDYNFELKPKIGTLKLISEPEEATVYVDGDKKGETPIFIRDLIIGEHSLKLEKDNYITFRKSIHIKEKEIIEDNIVLRKKNKTPTVNRTIQQTKRNTNSNTSFENENATRSEDRSLIGKSNKFKAKYYYQKANSYGKYNIEDAAYYYNKLFEIERISGRNKYTKLAKPKLNELIQFISQKGINNYNSKNYNEAARNFYLTYKLSPIDTVFLYNAAVSSSLDKNYNISLEYYKSLLNIGYTGISAGGNKKSKQPDILKNISYILINQGKKDEAVFAIKQARKANPKDLNLLLNEAQLYIKLEKMDKFRALMEEAVKLDPNNPVLFFNLGVINQNEKRTEEAVKYYKKAIQLKPNYGDAYLNLSIAILSGEEAIVKEMNDNSSNFKKYDELEKQQKILYKEALPYLEKADEISRTTDTVRTLLNIYDVLGMSEKADALRPIYKRMKG